MKLAKFTTDKGEVIVVECTGVLPESQSFDMKHVSLGDEPIAFDCDIETVPKIELWLAEERFKSLCRYKSALHTLKSLVENVHDPIINKEFMLENINNCINYAEKKEN